MTHSEVVSSGNQIESLSDRRARVLRIADSCFEMFTIRELLHQRSIRDEVLSSFLDSNESEVIEALSLALSWRRMVAESIGFPH
jgi:hypothetical protein